MKKFNALSFSAVILLTTLLIGGGQFTSARQTNYAEHPARGYWNVTTEPGDAEYSPRLMILSADGGAIFVSGYETVGIGAWEPTGETSAAVTFTMVTNGPAQIVVRVSIEVAPGGQAFTGTFTNEMMFHPRDVRQLRCKRRDWQHVYRRVCRLGIGDIRRSSACAFLEVAYRLG